MSRELIAADDNMSLSTYRLFLFLISKLNNGTSLDVNFTIDEFADAFKLTKSNSTRDIKSIKSFGDNVKFKSKDGTEYYPLSSYNFKDEIKVVSFNKDLSELLVSLKNNFAKLNFEYLAKLNSKIAIKLYSRLKLEKNMTRSKNRNGSSVVNIDIDSIHAMRKTISYDKRYISSLIFHAKNDTEVREKNKMIWQDLKANSLNPAINSINQNTDIKVSYEVIKTGRKVSSLNFIY